MQPFDDPQHPLNDPIYRTGHACIEECGRPAGTYWSPFFCQQCNAVRLAGSSCSGVQPGLTFKPANDDV